MAVDDGGVIRITLRDVYETAQSVKTNVELLVWSAAVAAKTQDDHESRIRVIEKRVWAIPSAAALLAVASLVVSLLSMNSGRTVSPSTPQSARTPSTITAPVRAATRPQAVTVATSRPTPASPAPGTVATSPTTTAPKPPSTSPPTVPTLPPVTLPPVISKPLSEILATIP